MTTFAADLLPFELCEDHGLYLMDPVVKFDCNVAVYNSYGGYFVGLLQSDLLKLEKHTTLGGAARPVRDLRRVYPGRSIEPYSITTHITETPMQTRASIVNWDLFNYLEEYEEAFLKGALTPGR